MREYIVKENDTIFGVAKAELHSAMRYEEIVAENHLMIGTLEPGQVLRLPEEEGK